MLPPQRCPEASPDEQAGSTKSNAMTQTLRRIKSLVRIGRFPIDGRPVRTRRSDIHVGVGGPKKDRVSRMARQSRALAGSALATREVMRER